ncbi:ATP-grasp domain-containing protein [Atopobacter sp. AH10]|uniref:carboxylate--amine ligase n=1 Tax=Atopobacter sp. AH10 TaxID=2315861 RepID=UPI0013145EA1|nr:ATP-grasp domain-containing protein [Atopobacter sp. AH10]
MEVERQFIPVILGGNRGAYSLARAMHEAYQIPSELALKAEVGPVMDSQIVNYHFYPDIRENFETCMNDLVRELEDKYPNLKKIVFGSEDWYVEHIIQYRKVFPDKWTVPYVDMSTLKKAVDKARFYEMCEKIGVAYPKTWTVKEPILPKDAKGRLVVKPAITPSYQNLKFKGKAKVYFCENAEEAQNCLTLMRNGGYPDAFIIQEWIEGSDSDQAVVTCYRSIHDCQVKLLSFGRILVEDHSKGGVGNHLVVLTENDHSDVFEQVKKLMEAFDFTGFANFDLIYDKKRGEFVFFELNPRLGVSNYYVTAGGQNVARYYIEDYLYNRPVELSAQTTPHLFTLLPKALLLYLLRNSGAKRLVKMLYKNGDVSHPLDYKYESSAKRKRYVFLSKINFYRKLFKAHQI